MLNCQEDINFGFRKINTTPVGKCGFHYLRSIKYSVACINSLLTQLLINNSASRMQLGILCKVGGYILMVFNFS